MKLVKSIGLFLLAVTIITLLFNFSSPMFKTKTSLRILGIDDVNNSEFSQTSDLILSNKFERFDSLNLIDPIHKEYLKEYHSINKTYRKDTLKSLELKDLYAIQGERWNSTDNITSGLKFMKFEYAYCSEKSLILCTAIGGLGSSYLFEVFAIQNEKMILVNTINVLSSDLFFMALSLKFDKSLNDYNTLMSDQDQLLNPNEN